MKLIKVKEILCFDEEAFIRGYINHCIEQRKLAKN